jgi:hypothetical protein
MTDAIAQAAADMAAAPSSTEPHTDAQAAMSEVGKPSSMPSSTEPVPTESTATAGALTLPSASSSTDTSNPSPATTAPQTGNVLANSTPTAEAPNVAPAADVGGQEAGAAPAAGGDSGNAQAAPVTPNSSEASFALAETSGTATDASIAGSAIGSAELPRESHLMLLEHKLAAMHAKFKTGERIVIDEFEQILGHIKAVL